MLPFNVNGFESAKEKNYRERQREIETEGGIERQEFRENERNRPTCLSLTIIYRRHSWYNHAISKKIHLLLPNRPYMVLTGWVDWLLRNFIMINSRIEKMPGLDAITQSRDIGVSPPPCITFCTIEEWDSDNCDSHTNLYEWEKSGIRIRHKPNTVPGCLMSWMYFTCCLRSK